MKIKEFSKCMAVVAVAWTPFMWFPVLTLTVFFTLMVMLIYFKVKRSVRELQEGGVNARVEVPCRGCTECDWVGAVAARAQTLAVGGFFQKGK